MELATYKQRSRDYTGGQGVRFDGRSLSVYTRRLGLSPSHEAREVPALRDEPYLRIDHEDELPWLRAHLSGEAHDADARHDAIFDRLDGWLCEGEFKRANALLRTLAQPAQRALIQQDVNAVIILLMALAPRQARAQLPAYGPALDHVRGAFLSSGVWTKAQVNGLLKGF